MAWQLALTRKDIRRSEANYRLHNFLISETKNGTVSRQETVSMIPPLVLDVKSHHKVNIYGNSQFFFKYTFLIGSTNLVEIIHTIKTIILVRYKFAPNLHAMLRTLK